MTWQKGFAGSTRGVQNAFVANRLREINSSRNHRDLMEKTCAQLKLDVPTLRRANNDQLLAAFIHMTVRLQEAPLTINFKAPNWFSSENPYDDYTQMYERAVKNGKMMLTNDDPLNPARTRAGIDDHVTFPTSWVEVSNLAGKPVYKVNAPEMPARGLSPDAAKSRLLSRMSPGELKAEFTPIPNSLQKNMHFEASNTSFDPMSKQLFTALNYGRRMHGSSTRYGHSHMVLSDRFKQRALYFAGDTFGSVMGQMNNSAHQLSYVLLGCVYLKATAVLRGDLEKSCLNDQVLPDTSEENLLLEAHLFEPLKFTGGISTICISAKDGVKDSKGKEEPLTGVQLQVIRENAHKFASKHGVRLVFVE